MHVWEEHLCARTKDFLASCVHVVVGTPGRVFDMLRRQSLRLDNIKMFVLDEADEMLSRGFKDQIYDIFQLLPAKIQACCLLYRCSCSRCSRGLARRRGTGPPPPPARRPPGRSCCRRRSGRPRTPCPWAPPAPTVAHRPSVRCHAAPASLAWLARPQAG